MPELNTRYGLISVPETETDFIGRFLARYGEWSWIEAMFLASLLPDRARILDIGAFIGTFSLGLAALKKLDFVCLVEANNLIMPHLRENIRRRESLPTVVLEALVAGDKQTRRVGWSESENLGATCFVSRDFPAEAATRVDAPADVVTLAELHETYGDFDLVKLDAEGMEREILAADTSRLA